MQYPTVSGSSFTLQLTTDSSGDYYYSGNGPIWASTSDVVALSVSGGLDVPAFDANVSPPSALTYAITGWTAGYALSTAQDLQVTWTGGSVGTAVFALSNAQSTTPLLSCTFSAAAGTASIPHAALGALDASVTYRLYLYTRNRVDTTAGDWTIELSAIEYPTMNYYFASDVQLVP
jgi:hypothetical protein